MPRYRKPIHSPEQKRRFIVIKNTLPYIHPWGILDTNTNTKLKLEYKKESDADMAATAMNHNQNNSQETTYEADMNHGQISAIEALEKRREKPCGSIVPKRDYNPNKRIIKL